MKSLLSSRHTACERLTASIKKRGKSYLHTEFLVFALTISWPASLLKDCLPQYSFKWGIDICIDNLFFDTNTIHNLGCNYIVTLWHYMSNHWQYISHFSSLIKSYIDKLIVLQWVPHLVQFLWMHFYEILKNSGSQNVPLLFYPKSWNDMLMMFL